MDEALMYTFLPILLIHKVLIKIKHNKVNGILIAPPWLHQHWFGVLLELSTASLLELPLWPNFLSQNFHLKAWQLHG